MRWFNLPLVQHTPFSTSRYHDSRRADGLYKIGLVFVASASFNVIVALKRKTVLKTAMQFIKRKIAATF